MSKPQSWKPRFVEALRLALRPILVYLAFNATGFMAFIFSIVVYDHASDLGLLLGACFAGMVGVVLGQLVALLRIRLWPILMGGVLCAVLGAVLISGAGGRFPDELAVPLFFFVMAFPCGLLSLQHRFELFSLFWPAVGWIGSVMVILNREDRAANWESNKISAWLPVPLFFLFCFLAFMLFFLAAKQGQRVRLWEALSGALERRVETRQDQALPRPKARNTIPMVVILVALFAFTAILAPFLWRTGRGDRDSDNKGAHSKEMSQHGDDEEEGKQRGHRFDEQAVMKMLNDMAESARHNAHYLLPLLLLLALYRPAKRAFVTTHLKTPVFPQSPSERIENLWEYVRIVAEDAGVSPSNSDSVEELLVRVQKTHVVPGDMVEAAQIYARSRYGYAIAPGDGAAMRRSALRAAQALKEPMTVSQKVRAWWRPLR
jgi:nitrogen fixation-related uncharacterized protein